MSEGSLSLPQEGSLSLPQGCQIRRAVAADSWPLRLMVLGAKLDPTQLRWQQFWLIEDAEKKAIACGQLRQFPDAEELGSLVVAKSWRDRNLGSILTQHLIQQSTQPLYLECIGKRLAQFYARFGFVTVDRDSLPRSLQRKFGPSHLARTLFGIPIFFMHLKPGSGSTSQAL